MAIECCRFHYSLSDISAIDVANCMVRRNFSSWTHIDPPRAVVIARPILLAVGQPTRSKKSYANITAGLRNRV